MGNKIFEKVIPEILVIVLLILAAFGYVMSGEYINSHKIYEGQYALQYKNGGRIADIKYVEDLKNLEGVEHFVGDTVDTKNWYLMDIYLNTNNKFILEYENVLVSADGTDDGTYKLTIKDGTASIYKNSGEKYVYEEGEIIRGYDCEFSLYFSGNALVAKSYTSGEVDYHYMEKVGSLSYYNAQIFQVGCVIACGVLIAVYLFMVLFRGGRTRLIIVPICAVLIFAGLFFTKNTSICGEYTNSKKDRYFIINEGKDKDYLLLTGDKIDFDDAIEENCTFEMGALKVDRANNEWIATNNGAHSFLYLKEATVDTEAYTSVTHLPVRDVNAYVYLGLSLVGSVLGFVFRFKNKKETGEAIWKEDEPYIGSYKVCEPVYLGESFKGMENYFGANVKDEMVTILFDKFVFMDDEISEPKYDIKKFKFENFKGHQVVIEDSDFEIYFNDSKTYLAKNMNGVTMVVYRIKKAEA